MDKHCHPKAIARALIDKGVLTEIEIFDAYYKELNKELDNINREKDSEKSKPWYKKIF